MKKILLLGKNSGLGKQLKISLENRSNLVCLGRKDLDVLANFSQLEKIIRTEKPEYIINCIAITKFIDAEKNPKLAYDINSIFPLMLANVAKTINAFLLHFSSESVFSGLVKKLPTEDFFPSPLTVYGKSKFLSETGLLSLNNNLIIRLPTLVGPTHDKQIIYKIMTKIKEKKDVYVSRQIMSTPLYTPLFAEFFFKHIICNEKIIKRKLINVTSKKKLSTFQIIKLISKLMKINSKIIPVNESFFGQKYFKPKNLGLATKYKDCILDFAIDKNHFNI
jgi:dTDP-4-dehydrorhamnose reductase